MKALRLRVLLGIVLAILLLVTLVPIASADDPTISVTNVTVTAYMGVPIITASSATNITDVSATLHGYITSIGGSNVTCRGFEWGYASGNYTTSWNETGTFDVGASNHTISSLIPTFQVFWRAFAINAQGQGNSTELNFYTITLPSPPTDFTVTEVGNTIATITWSMGMRANTTIIRGGSSGYPQSISDGYLVYSGNETETTIVGLDLDTTTYYYRAWSQNEYGYSRTYAQDYAGNPIGLPTLLFVIGLCGFAFWKKDWIRVLLAICIIIWGTFAMPYDIKIAAPLLAVGTLLFIMGIVHVIQTRQAQEG